MSPFFFFSWISEHFAYHVSKMSMTLKPCSDLCQETRPKQILCQESLRRILKYKWGWLIPRCQNRCKSGIFNLLTRCQGNLVQLEICVNDFDSKSELLKPHVFDWQLRKLVQQNSSQEIELPAYCLVNSSFTILVSMCFWVCICECLCVWVLMF